jgi:hypothetical protein
MITDIVISAYFILLSLSLVLSYTQKAFLAPADKWIGILLLLTITSEAVAEVMARKFGNNLHVYHFYNPLEFLVICFYFNERIKALKRRHIGIWIGISGILLSVLNSIYLQPTNTINSNFLMLEAAVIIALCIYAFYCMIKEGYEHVIHHTQFWVASIFIFYRSFVFFYWGTYSVFAENFKPFAYLLVYMLWTVNILTYAGFAALFIRYRKMISASE